MKKLPAFCVLLVVLVVSVRAAAPRFAPLPAPISNNAVASLKIGKRHLLFTFMGIGPGKTWKDISGSAYQLDLSGGKWDELRSIPGTAGRLAATAIGLRGQVFLLGGYLVAGDGSEGTVSDVDVYEPVDHRWYRGADIPVPVDDAVSGEYRDRYIYLVGGWSNNDAVRNVQIYDTEKNVWQQGTPIPGTPVFGHAGAVVGGTIVYVDGAYKNPASANPRYLASDECWQGKIDHHDLTKIEWSKIPPHPGNARYRIAAAAASGKDQKIYFSGGTDNPYNYNGIGYDGRSSEPSAVTFAWDAKDKKWETINENTPDATMDHRGLVVTPVGLVTIGGMEKGQNVVSRVAIISKGSKGK
jgi:N-acetylneuraminic acid mutarotase